MQLLTYYTVHTMITALLSCAGLQLKFDRLQLRNKPTNNIQLTIKELHQ